jgi:hypothetical protein
MKSPKPTKSYNKPENPQDDSWMPLCTFVLLIIVSLQASCQISRVNDELADIKAKLNEIERNRTVDLNYLQNDINRTHVMLRDQIDQAQEEILNACGPKE